MKRLVIGLGIVAVVLFALVVVAVRDQEEPSVTIGATQCVRDQQVVLTAQSVPDASLVPCLTDDATKWMNESSSFTNDGTTLTLRNQTVPDAQWTMTFTPTCQPDAGAQEQTGTTDGRSTDVATVDEPPPPSGESAVARRSWTRFAGGCVATTVTVPANLDRELILRETDGLLDLIPRSVLSDDVRAGTDGQLSL